MSDLSLVGAQSELVQSVVSAMSSAGKKSVVVFVSGKPVAEPWIQEHAGAVVQQFYPGELVRSRTLFFVCVPYINDHRVDWLSGSLRFL